MRLKILQLHNNYQVRGGEDSVVNTEFELLSQRHIVHQLIFENSNSGIKQAFNLFFNPFAINKLQKTLKEFKPDLVHIHNLFYTASPHLINIIKDASIPIVYTLHNYRWICSAAILTRNGAICTKCLDQKALWPGVFHKCFRNSFWGSALLNASIYYHKKIGTLQRIDKVLTLTNFHKKIILTNIVELNGIQLTVKPNFIKNSIEQNDLPKSGFIFVGRLSNEKGIEVLLQAISFLPSNLKVQIIGEGPLEAIIDHSQVVYLGKKSKEEILALMKSCKAIILPSICYEGLPMTIIEAFSVGTPVICSNNENLASIVTHGYNGVLFEQGNPQALADAINNFDDLGGQMNKNAYQTYLDRYTAEANLHLLESIYEEVCGIKVS